VSVSHASEPPLRLAVFTVELLLPGSVWWDEEHLNEAVQQLNETRPRERLRGLVQKFVDRKMPRLGIKVQVEE
jgi:hypothetical protein